MLWCHQSLISTFNSAPPLLLPQLVHFPFNVTVTSLFYSVCNYIYNLIWPMIHPYLAIHYITLVPTVKFCHRWFGINKFVMQLDIFSGPPWVWHQNIVEMCRYDILNIRKLNFEKNHWIWVIYGWIYYYYDVKYYWYNSCYFWCKSNY